jgi:hypothetical protein
MGPPPPAKETQQEAAQHRTRTASRVRAAATYLESRRHRKAHRRGRLGDAESRADSSLAHGPGQAWPLSPGPSPARLKESASESSSASSILAGLADTALVIPWLTGFSDPRAATRKPDPVLTASPARDRHGPRHLPRAPSCIALLVRDRRLGAQSALHPILVSCLVTPLVKSLSGPGQRFASLLTRPGARVEDKEAVAGNVPSGHNRDCFKFTPH